jgi:cysteine desulfurase
MVAGLAFHYMGATSDCVSFGPLGKSAVETIYLDNNATTRPAAEVVEAMGVALRDLYGNPSSLHRLGQAARHAVDEARDAVAELVGSAPGELTFTSGGSESINAALHGLFLSRAPRKRVITSTVEHAATRGACESLAAAGAEVVAIPVSAQGELDLPRRRNELTQDPALG